MNFISALWLASVVGSFFSPQFLLRTSDYFLATFPVKGFFAHSLAPSLTPSAVRSTGASASAAASSTLVSSRRPIAFASAGAGLAGGLAYSPVRDPYAGLQSLAGKLSNLSRRAVEAARPAVNVVPADAAGASINASTANASTASASANGATANKTTSNSSSNPQVTTIQSCSWFYNATPSVAKGFQVQVNGATVATVARRDQADAIADQMRGVLRDPQFDPATLRTGIVDGKPAGLAGDRLLFVVNSSVSRRQGQNAEILAIEWINNLRTAFDQEPVALSAAQNQMWALSPTGKDLEGTASWYGPRFHGRLTANGEIFDQNTLTAAHPSLPFNTYLEVTNLETGRSVVVRINDRGPYIGLRSLDLSRAAARCLDSESSGVIPYRASILQQAPSKGNVELQPEPLLAEQDGRLARRN